MSNKTYDIFKKIVLIGVPALITLVAGLLTVFEVDSGIATKIVTALGLVETFLGSIIELLSSIYKKKNSQEEGDGGTDSQ